MNATANNRTPVTIVTGFLGSGKTTLLNRLLREAHGKRIAIIENEFGEVSIDDALIESANQSVFKLSNGCLCCTINGDLIGTLQDLAKRKSEFDYVIIETTGVANPAPVVQTFMVNEDIADEFELDSVVTLVDAKHISLHISTKECKEQIAFADIVVLNKLDLVSDADLAVVEQLIGGINSIARVVKTTRSDIDLSQILGQGAFSKSLALPTEAVTHDHDHSGEHTHGPECSDDGCEGDDHSHEHDHEHGHLHHHHHDDDIESVGLELQGNLDQAKFNSWFGQLISASGDSLYRSKGILSVAGRDNRVIVQTVHRVSEVNEGASWGADSRLSKIVFIGKNLDKTLLLNGLTDCLSK